MNIAKQNILFIVRTMGLGGTENVVLQLCKILCSQANKIVVCSSGGVHEDLLHEMGIKHYSIPDISSKHPRDIVESLIKIKSVIKKEEITIVHTHHRMATLYMKIISGITNVRVISTLHGVFDDNHAITKFAYKNIDIIACGNVVKERFVNNFGIDPTRISVIRNAVEMKRVEITPIKELSHYRENNNIVAYIGRLSPEKGIDVLIKAVAEVVSRNKDIVFAIAGEGSGDYKKYIWGLIDELEVNKNILFLGYRSDVQNVIEQVDFVVLPSNTEGLPLTPIEAFSLGKTVVATKAGGTVEIVTHGFNGLLCEIGNYQQMAKEIIELCNDVSLRNDLSRNAYITYQRDYSFEKFREDTLAYYEKL